MKFVSRNKKWIIVLVIVILLLSASDKSGEDKVSNDRVTQETSESILVEPVTYERLDTNPQARGNRLLGVGLTEGSIGFDKAFALGQEAGIQVVAFSAFWDAFEPKARKYESGLLPTLNNFFSIADMKIALSLNPIDTNNLRLPKDLKNKPFDDPEVIERFKLFVDFVASQLPDSDILYVAIGNEIDGYLGDSDKLWKEYTEFFAAVAPHVRTKFPDALIGSKVIYNGIVNMSDKVKTLNDYADMVLVTYYPFEQGGFIVRDPATVHADFKRIVELYPNKKIYFAEIGYPSGTDNKSSEEKQAIFIEQTFIAWDTYRSSIPFLNFLWLHDVSKDTVNDWQKYYGLKNKAFASFLGTLGLRTYDGESKQAFTQLVKEASVRGW